MIHESKAAEVVAKSYAHLTIGVLALQGDYEAHARQLKAVGANCREVRLARDLTDLDGLIIPGGESTTMNILIDRFDLREPLVEFIGSKPVWGTCAGMIMLAEEITDNLAAVKPLGGIDIKVIRNGYGRQVFSFEEKLSADLDGHSTELTVSFIRAPKVVSADPAVKILAEFKGSPVLVSEGHLLASSFHSELSGETVLLEYFLGRFFTVREK